MLTSLLKIRSLALKARRTVHFQFSLRDLAPLPASIRRRRSGGRPGWARRRNNSQGSRARRDCGSIPVNARHLAAMRGCSSGIVRSNRLTKPSDNSRLSKPTAWRLIEKGLEIEIRREPPRLLRQAGCIARRSLTRQISSVCSGVIVWVRMPAPAYNVGNALSGIILKARPLKASASRTRMTLVSTTAC